MKKLPLLILLGASLVVNRVHAQDFNFTTGSPDGRMATASRTDLGGALEIESADDFIVPIQGVHLTNATFTGLIPTGASSNDITQLQIEIYRVFPNDSDVNRTSGPLTTPPFSTAQVPTRVNSPSDVAFDTKDVLSGGLSFTPTILGSFTAANSILNGINPKPGQTTGGEGPVTGQEVQFDVSFTAPFNLPAGHYFFVPQVNLSSGDFFWLSAAGPALFTGDLQAWIRNGNLDPDWLRQGTDIVGGGLSAPKFNDSFSLTGTLPDSGSTFVLFTCAAAILFSLKRRFRA
jgi:protein with PEP-CTERM/exosortase system signal